MGGGNNNMKAVERETIISFDDASDECQIYTCSRPVMTKLDRLCKSQPDNYKLSKTYTTNKGLISFRADKQKREMTEEQKKAQSDRMKKLRADGKL
jgi:hypothetical protein